MINISTSCGIILSFLLGFLTSSIAIADDDASWSYDHYKTDRKNEYAEPKKNINPWSGERNGPKASSREEQFNYGEDSPADSPPTIDDLYPQSGVNQKAKRPWGSIPKSFQDEEKSYRDAKRKKRVERDRYLQRRQQWPDSDTRYRDGYDSGRRGERYVPENRYIDREYGRSMQQPYREFPQRYGDYPRYPYGSLYNDSDLGYGSWQRSNPWGGDRSLYRNNYLIPRY
ncbi:MAG: hypothetical protein HQL71_15575 [Magnetococcales bacterium]|nr:hypothetical protein [Magnetococcales bacterium]